ncbi:MAG: preprotein translocase subunit SecA [Clostridia bacterium]|nr:preprotein translocase subunit SecA [Clostridia bacterium]MBR4099607.1 preprotein translocase subunit SecA [Clostridia bacterium]MBR6741671.1 preprotein translocase subunit SecA [Clostridia bacterium]
MSLFKKLFGDYSQKEIKRILPLQQKVLSLEEEYKALSDEALRAKTQEFRDRLASGETLDDILPEAFAACREAGDRVLGMRHFPVQIIGGIILHQGRIAEMKTGEGKTLVATLPAYLNALTGKGVHIVTVNDYLAKRDSEWMGKLYKFMGLTVGLIVHGMTKEDKKEAYNADITYCTNNELGFDYLRDNMVIYKDEKVQREHNFAIVDEVDSILVDEARTPLIISGQSDKSTDLYESANRFARSLKMFKIKEMDDKASDEDTNYDGDYVVDEKARSCTLTPEGVRKAEEYFNIENLNDSENIAIAHHINQAIRAYGIMKRDVDYVVKDGEVIIVDEFTGRLMYGRRYNEGLHQAIEAKEGVKIAKESKTLATITFQNFFRLYNKLSGMTGTAMTEEVEFQEIYKLDVIEIPTNKPIARVDENDVVYKTEKAKFGAVIDKIIACHEKGQPVLVGTVTIEKSELLSAMLKRRGINHNVLNAKHHEKEAEIIAQAGKLGAVTIATNMAGRGTDIMLGGNAEYLAKSALRHDGLSEEMIIEATGFAETDDSEILAAREKYTEYYNKFKAEIAPEAEKVRNAGGLAIIGTERHDSRRIDNQLRGRAGRQGDSGNTQFFISLEDDLMRLFGGERISTLMDTLKVEEDMPLENSMLSHTIENAQKKKEGMNFAIRKNVLQYDDVMNKQREIIYGQRSKVLDGEDLKETVLKMIDDTIDAYCGIFLADNAIHDNWDVKGLREYFLGWITTPADLHFTTEELGNTSREEVAESLKEKARAIYEAREKDFGSDMMREIERVMLLRSVDTNWMDHIDAMDQLRQGIGLRAYGQHDPVVEYRNDSFDMFEAMTNTIREQTAKLVLSVRIKKDEEVKREKVANETGTGDKPLTVRGKGVVGKNALCPCGSGKKYKRCCGKDLD